MAKDKTTVRFWLRTDRPNQDGSSPVHIIYQIQGQRKYFAVPGIKLFPANWSVNDQRAVLADRKQLKKAYPGIDPALLLTTIEVSEVNAKLQEVASTIADIEKRFRLDKITFTPQMVIDSLKSSTRPEVKRAEPGVNIVDFIHRFCDETTDHREGTLKSYRGLARHMADFEKSRKTKFTFKGDSTILQSFSGYLSSLKVKNKKTGALELKVNNITKSKLISTFKTLVRFAKRPPYKIELNPDYLDYREKSLKRMDSGFEVIALTSDELDAILALDLLGNKSLDQIRDIFCFSCTTGLRYGDLAQLSRKHLRRDSTIYIPASDKNSKPIEVPLNPISYNILEKYKTLPTPLPVSTQTGRLISDQKLNVGIKKVGQLAGINTLTEIVRPYGLEDVSLGEFEKHQLLSIHCGRKTFTTLSLEKGIPIQDVMALTTHTSFRAVKRYIDVTKERKKSVMAQAWGTINPLKAAK